MVQGRYHTLSLLQSHSYQGVMPSGGMIQCQ
jgi:hypothetical protein